MKSFNDLWEILPVNIRNFNGWVRLTTLGIEYVLKYYIRRYHFEEKESKNYILTLPQSSRYPISARIVGVQRECEWDKQYKYMPNNKVEVNQKGERVCKKCKEKIDLYNSHVLMTKIELDDILRERIQKFMKKTRSKPQETRMGGIYVSKSESNPQFLPYVFIRQNNGKSGVFVCNNSGVNSNARLELISLIHRAYPFIQIYYIEHPRYDNIYLQSSDALYTLKCLLKVNKNGQYHLANLIDFFQQNAYKGHCKELSELNALATKLPKPLLNSIGFKRYFNPKERRPKDHDRFFLQRKGWHYCKVILMEIGYETLKKGMNENKCGEPQKKQLQAEYLNKAKSLIKSCSGEEKKAILCFEKHIQAMVQNYLDLHSRNTSKFKNLKI